MQKVKKIMNKGEHTQSAVQHEEKRRNYKT